MSHVVGHEHARLQQRLDRNVTGAPDSPVFQDILRLLFSPEEAAVAARLPTRLTSLTALSRRLGLPEARLDEMLTSMAERGLVLDIEHDGRRLFSLAPVVIGFFEFTFMRTRDSAPMPELARLFDRYMMEDDRFARSVFQGSTQLGRTLAYEEALPEGGHTEVLDWERASHLVRTASATAVSLCACRHKEQHLDRACDAPLRACLSLNHAAETLVRTGIAETIAAGEAMDILERCKEAGLAQTGDNVRRGVSFICNCCGCCCGMMAAIRRFDIAGAIVSSNYVATLESERCLGCGRCARACPIGAIDVAEDGAGKAVLHQDLCLGCGVCVAACRRRALALAARPRRLFTPENGVAKLVAMAIERGKLADLICEAPESLSERALWAIVAAIERTAPWKAAMAVRPLRSVFLSAAATAAGRAAGPAR